MSGQGISVTLVLILIILMVAVVMFELSAVSVAGGFREGNWTGIKKETVPNDHGSAITVNMEQHLTSSETMYQFVRGFLFPARILVNERELSGASWTVISSNVLYR